MKLKFKIKIALNIAMTVALLFLMGYQFWGEEAHEWVGIGIFVMFIAHNILNLGWYKSLFNGRYAPMRVFQLGVNMLTFITMLAMMYSSIFLSRYALGFLHISGGMSLARKLHILGSHWGMVFMSMHIGLHWNMVLTMVKKRNVSTKFSSLRNSIYFLIGLVIAAYGAYVFIDRDFPTYLFLRSEFVFLDHSESRILYYLDYMSLMGIFIFCHIICLRDFKSLAAKRKRRRRQHEKNNSIFCSIVRTFSPAACASDQGEVTSELTGVHESMNVSKGSTADSNDTPVISAETPHQNVGNNILLAYFAWADNTVAENPDAVDTDATTSASVLVPGNTAKLAGRIQEYTGGDMFSIKVVEWYSSDYDECLDRAADEKADNVRPELVSHVDYMEQYDTIFLGSPNWWHSLPMAMFSFIEEYDLSGKTIVPFCAHGTGGLASSEQDISAVLPDSTDVMEPIGVYRPDIDSAQPVINYWLETLGFKRANEDAADDDAERRITMMVGEQPIPITLYDSPAATSLYEKLPLELTFEDFNGIEKISYLPKPLNTEGEPDGFDPAQGDLCLYEPWGNLSIFYEDFRYSESLIKQGISILERKYSLAWIMTFL